MAENYVVECRHIVKPVSESDWEVWTAWYELKGFEDAQKSRDWLAKEKAVRDKRWGVTYEYRVRVVDGRFFDVNEEGAPLLMDVESEDSVEKKENEGYRIEFRLSYGGAGWTNLLEEDAPKLEKIGDALQVIHEEIKQDFKDGTEYEYRVFNPFGKEVEGLEDALKSVANREKVEVGRERLDALTAMELRLGAALSEREKSLAYWADELTKAGSSSEYMRIAHMKAEAGRDVNEFKLILGRG